MYNIKRVGENKMQHLLIYNALSTSITHEHLIILYEIQIIYKTFKEQLCYAMRG